MNFTPVILTYISTWSREHSLGVDVRLDFENSSMRLVFSFIDNRTAKVWNKAYETDFLRNYNISLYDLVKQTLKEAERYFEEVR